MAGGAPDPALMQLLFSRQSARRREAAAAQMAKISAGIQFEKERRANELHKQNLISARIKNAQSLATLNSSLSDLQQVGEQQAEKGIAQARSQNISRELQDPAGRPSVLGGPGFAEIAFENDPTVFDPTQGEQRAIRSQAQGPFNRANALASELGGVTEAQNRQNIQARTLAGELKQHRGVEADKASQIFTAKLAAGALPRKIATSRGVIEGLRTKLRSMPAGTRAYDRVADDLTAQAMGLVRLGNEGVAGAIPEARKQLIADVAFAQRSQDQALDLERFLAVARNNPDFIGYQGRAAGIEQFFVDAGVDLRAIVANQIRGFFDDETIEDSIKDTVRESLGGLLGPGDEVLAQRTTDLALLSKGIKFSLVRMNNPNRFAQAQVKDFEDFVDFKGGTSSQIIRQMDSVLQSLRKASDRTLDRVALFNRALGLGLEGSLTTTDPAGRSRVVIPTPTGTDFKGLRKPSASEFLRMSPAAQARFLSEQGGR